MAIMKLKMTTKTNESADDKGVNLLFLTEAKFNFSTKVEKIYPFINGMIVLKTPHVFA